MDEDYRPDAREPPRRFHQTKCLLYSARYESALPLEKQKRDHANERRKRGGKRCYRAQYPTPRELKSPEQERQRHADQQ